VPWDTPEQHVEDILAWIAQAHGDKYMAGQEGHGGRLWRKRVIESLEDEMLDFLSYFHVIKYQWSLMEAICEDAFDGRLDPVEALRQIQNVLEVGNPEGVREEGD